MQIRERDLENKLIRKPIQMELRERDEEGLSIARSSTSSADLVCGPTFTLIEQHVTSSALSSLDGTRKHALDYLHSPRNQTCYLRRPRKPPPSSSVTSHGDGSSTGRNKTGNGRISPFTSMSDFRFYSFGRKFQRFTAHCAFLPTP